MNYDHFLITRFNIRAYSPEIVLKSTADIGISEEWLSHRFQIFEQYCYPSICNQKNKNFKWLVFFDEATPSKYLKKIKLFENCIQFTPIFLNQKSDFNEHLMNHIKKNVSNASKIVTTRLDNDDSLHVDFIDTIQLIAKTREKCLIDIRNGYQVTVLPNKYEIRAYHPPFNHFISIVEPISEFKSVFERIHPAWDCPEMPCYIFDKRPLWIEFIHGKNNLYHTRNYLKRLIKVPTEKFGISEEINDNPINVLSSNILKYSHRLLGRTISNK